MDSYSPTTFPNDPLAKVLERNIEAIVRRRKAEEAAQPMAERVSAAITRFTGSLKFVYLHLALFGFWIIANLPGVPFPKFDPTYVVLAMWASVEAIFLSTFVLITQNRTAALADRRDDLNLQISLLAEHEVTRLIHLVTAIAHKLNIDEARNPELDELKRDVAPEKVLDSISAKERRAEETRPNEPFGQQ
ncbi:MAG TPA: DUF1003 domain-containing protein [Chthoniobacteraceae bacterium]|jgi:uncharacterized membrane protein|nr:hypothetical protein [Chthoniobacter sp.]HEV7869049.1 DUF1003 domain-containing protein [Chthoniobacteraceae bacterium]